MDAARAVGHRRLEGRLHQRRCFVLHHLGREDEAEQTIQEALLIHQELGDRVLQAATRGSMGSRALQRGQLAEALAQIAAALAVERGLGIRPQEALSLLMLGRITAYEGRIALAGEHLREALVVAKACGSRAKVALAQNYLGMLALEDGRPGDALEPLLEAVALERELGSPKKLGLALSSLGRCLGDLDRPEEALVAWEEALALHRRIGGRVEQVLVRLGRAELLRRGGQLGEAQANAEEALGLLGTHTAPGERVRALALRGRIAVDQADRSTAVGCLAAGEVVIQESELPPDSLPAQDLAGLAAALC